MNSIRFIPSQAKILRIEYKTPDGEMIYQFNTAVQGRSSYIEGTLMAMRFLHRQMAAGLRGQVFSMTDVIQVGGR